MADSNLGPKTRKYCCIPVRIDRACRIFAVMSAFKWGLLMLILFGMFCEEPSVAPMVFLIVVSIAFIFTLILCKGAYKRRADLVKIYMVFAVTLMGVFASIIILYALHTFDIVGGLVMLLILAFYSRSILVVKGTYELFLAEETVKVALMLEEARTKDYCSMEELAAAAPEVPEEP